MKKLKAERDIILLLDFSTDWIPEGSSVANEAKLMGFENQYIFVPSSGTSGYGALLLYNDNVDFEYCGNITANVKVGHLLVNVGGKTVDLYFGNNIDGSGMDKLKVKIEENYQLTGNDFVIMGGNVSTAPGGIYNVEGLELNVTFDGLGTSVGEGVALSDGMAHSGKSWYSLSDLAAMGGEGSFNGSFYHHAAATTIQFYNKYYVTSVENGTISTGISTGKFAAGTTVTLTAGAAPEGMVFDKWVVEGNATLENANSVTTTFTMPAGDVKVTATYKEAPSSFEVTVNGVVVGYYNAGATVTLTAEEQTGKTFNKWTATGVTLSDATSKTISFTMPAGNVSLTASYYKTENAVVVWNVSYNSANYSDFQHEYAAGLMKDNVSPEVLVICGVDLAKCGNTAQQEAEFWGYAYGSFVANQPGSTRGTLLMSVYPITEMTDGGIITSGQVQMCTATSTPSTSPPPRPSSWPRSPASITRNNS